MRVLAAVVCSASLEHFGSDAAAMEHEHSNSELVACLAAVAAEVVLPGSELVPDSEELLVSVADSNCLGSAIEGNL
ncbi:hypothetical protein AAC387_Pa06g1811 [Persea americana]